jgi:creatinine amidohydrolase
MKIKKRNRTFFYSDYTWPELKEVAREKRVVILPVGSVEDHGPHLPLDTDNLFVWEICVAAARKIPEKVLVMPLISYGFEEHHMDFPGPVTIDPVHFIDYLSDVAKSIARHGFKKILIVNSHGSNASLADIAARRVTLETSALCALVNTWILGRKEIGELRESVFPGGVSHACEYETSLYLHLAEDKVQKGRIGRDIPAQKSQFIWRDLERPSPVQLMEWWSSFSKTGVCGDPTKATREKGKRIFDASVQKLVDLSCEFQHRKILVRKDHH